MVVRLSGTAVATGLLLGSSFMPMLGQVARNGVPPEQIVIIKGVISGSKATWSSYQNGNFSPDRYNNDFFRVPPGKTLVIVEADLSVAGDTRKVINLDFVLKQGIFPLAHATLHNGAGISHFTVTKTFALGLVVPERSKTGQEGLLNVNIYQPQSSANYEVTLHGYYTN
jgi:hypothetical protein